MDKKGISLRIVAIIVAVIVIIAGVGIWYMYSQQQPQVQTGEPIRIGALMNLSGAFAPEGIRARLQITAWATEINVKGGMYLEKTGAYHPIEVVFYDAESQVSRATEFATKIATEKPVHALLLRGLSPPMSVPAVVNIEKIGGLPTVSTSPVDTMLDQCLPSIPGNKFTWTWHVAFNYTVYGQLWKGFLSQYKNQIAKIGMLLRDDTSGRDAYRKLGPRLEEAGFTLVFPGYFPGGISDFTSIIVKFKEENVDVVYVNCESAEWIAFRRQCATLGLKPKMFCVGRAMKIPEAEALGRELAEGITSETHWWYKLPYKGNEWYRENWQKLFGDMSMTHMEGMTYTGFHVLLEAIKIAGSLDKDVINNAFPQVELDMPTGHVKFRADHTCATVSTLAQYIVTPQGKWDMKIVYVPPGTGIQTEPATFPIP
ncbi:MAG: ABC transporter substrate-binding protein [Candidatus Bathyarchaeia archaeon]